MSTTPFNLKMNSNATFKLKIDEDELGPYLVIPPKLIQLLKLKKDDEATFRLLPNKGKLTFEITPN